MTELEELRAEVERLKALLRQSRKPLIPEEMYDEIAERYRNGETLNELARAYNVSTGPIIRAVRARKAKRSNKGRSLSSGKVERNNTLFAMREAGASFIDIGKEFGITAARAAQICRRMSQIKASTLA